jgi:hypothetical protein
MAANQSRRDLLKVGLAAIPVGNFGFSQPTANAQDPAPQAVVPDVLHAGLRRNESRQFAYAFPERANRSP